MQKATRAIKTLASSNGCDSRYTLPGETYSPWVNKPALMDTGKKIKSSNVAMWIQRMASSCTSVWLLVLLMTLGGGRETLTAHIRESNPKHEIATQDGTMSIIVSLYDGKARAPMEMDNGIMMRRKTHADVMRSLFLLQNRIFPFPIKKSHIQLSKPHKTSCMSLPRPTSSPFIISNGTRHVGTHRKTT